MGRHRKAVPCPRCGAIVSAGEAHVGHAGCANPRRKGVRGPIVQYVACVYCGRQITRSEGHLGHAGCTRVRRHRTKPDHNHRADPALLALAERDLENWWIAEGWGVRPPSVVE